MDATLPGNSSSVMKDPIVAIGKRERGDGEEEQSVSPSRRHRLKITRTAEREYALSHQQEHIDAPSRTAVEPRPMPSMLQRSRAEVYILGHTIRACTGCCTKDDLIDAMLAGEKTNKSDGYIFAIDAAFEYDDAAYHGDGDIVRDVSKTARLLALSPTMLILRLRVGGAPSLPVGVVSDPRCVIVETETRSLTKVVTAAADELSKVVSDDDFKYRLEQVARSAYKRDKTVDDVVHNVLLDIDRAYAAEVDAVTKLLEGDADKARKLLSDNGVKTRLASGRIAASLDILKEMGVKVEHLHTLSNDGFWSKAGTDAMKETLRLLKEMGVKVEHLHTLSNDGFWSKAGTDAMKETLRLLQEMGVKVEHLHTLSNAGFWSKAGTDAMKETLRLLQEMGVKVEHLHTLSNNGFWSKAGTDAMADTFGRLKDLGVDVDHLCSFDGSFWGLAGTETMRLVIAKLVFLEIPPKNFKTFGSRNSFWKCAKTTGLDVIDTLSRDYSVSIVDLLKLQNAFWSRVSNSDAWERLKAELAECRLPVDVTNVIKEINGRAFGRGATKCTFARPKFATQQRLSERRATMHNPRL